MAKVDLKHIAESWDRIGEGPGYDDVMSMVTELRELRHMESLLKSLFSEDDFDLQEVASFNVGMQLIEMVRK